MRACARAWVPSFMHFFAVVIMYVTVYRTDTYKRLKASLDRHSKQRECSSHPAILLLPFHCDVSLSSLAYSSPDTSKT